MNTLLKLLMAFVLQILGSDTPPETSQTSLEKIVECRTDTLSHYGYFINTQNQNNNQITNNMFNKTTSSYGNWLVATETLDITIN